MNTGFDDTILPKNQHLGEMKLFSTIDDSFKALAIHEVTYNIDSDHVDAQLMQPDSSPSNQCKIHSNSQPAPKTSIVIPRNVQIHRQVLLNDVKFSKKTKIALNNLLWKYDTIISKSDNDIGQTDLIKMNIATRPDAAPISVWQYCLVLKHYDFLKQEVKNLLDAGNIHKGMFPCTHPIVVVKTHTPQCTQQQFCLCIDYRKLNSSLLAVTPAIGTKKGTIALMPLLKIDELFALLKGAKYFTTLDLWSGYYHIQLDEESTPKSAFTTVFGKFEFLRLPFGLSQGPDLFIHLI